MSVTMYIDKFAKVVTIDEHHPLAIAQRAKPVAAPATPATVTPDTDTPATPTPAPTVAAPSKSTKRKRGSAP